MGGVYLDDSARVTCVARALLTGRRGALLRGKRPHPLLN